MTAREGLMTWAELRNQLAGAECLWQDLDGLHIGVAPEKAPPTSIIWAWAADRSALWRIRLDGSTARVAVHRPGGGLGYNLTPWGENDGRVKAYHASPSAGPLTDLAFAQHVEAQDGASIPVAFICRQADSRATS